MQPLSGKVNESGWDKIDKAIKDNAVSASAGSSSSSRKVNLS
jgi:hypothetical protein